MISSVAARHPVGNLAGTHPIMTAEASLRSVIDAPGSRESLEIFLPRMGELIDLPMGSGLRLRLRAGVAYRAKCRATVGKRRSISAAKVRRPPFTRRRNARVAGGASDRPARTQRPALRNRNRTGGHDPDRMVHHSRSCGRNAVSAHGPVRSSQRGGGSNRGDAHDDQRADRARTGQTEGRFHVAFRWASAGFGLRSLSSASCGARPDFATFARPATKPKPHLMKCRIRAAEARRTRGLIGPAVIASGTRVRENMR